MSKTQIRNDLRRVDREDLLDCLQLDDDITNKKIDA